MQQADLADARVLSVRQPWASMIVHGIKKIESRSWRTHWRGTLLIHACGGLGRGGTAALQERLDELANDLSSDQWLRARGAGLGHIGPWGRNLEPTPFLDVRGSVVGAAQLCRVMPAADALSEFTDQIPLADAFDWAWILEGQFALPAPVAYRGGQGLRRPEPSLLATLASATGS